MEYAQAGNAINQGYASASALGQIKGAAQNAPVKSPTIAGAVGRIESLHTRLQAITAQLSAISDAVGGPRPTAERNDGGCAASGVVYRLNDGADAAHRQAAEIEDLLNSISRALG